MRFKIARGGFLSLGEERHSGGFIPLPNSRLDFVPASSRSLWHSPYSHIPPSSQGCSLPFRRRQSSGARRPRAGRRCGKAPCQIDNVDVVADPRSVRGIVLIAVNAQIRELPEQGAGDVGGKVVWGLLTAVLADEPGGMCADGVEVAQRGKAEVVALPREIMQEQLDLRIAQIVGNDNVIAGIQKLHHRVAPNKTRTARHQYRHGSCSSLFRLFLADFAFFAQSNPFCSNFDIYQDFFRLFSLA